MMAEQVSSQQDKLPPVLGSYARLVVLVGLLLLAGSGLFYLINRSWAFETELGASLGAVLLLVVVLLRPDVVRTVLAGRSIKYASHAVVTSLAFIGILSLINFLCLKNNQEYDLTETKQFTLSPQTIQILKNLDQPVQVMGFFQAGDRRLALAENYLGRYRRYTNKITYEFHDPNVEPALAQSFELSNYGLVFVSGDHHREVASIDEQTITTELMHLTGSNQQKTIYFVTGGYSRYSLSDNGPDGYSLIRQALERENYLVHEVNLAAYTSLPSDTNVLILVSPSHAPSTGEGQLIANWMGQGGKLMLLVDPFQPVPLSQVLQAFDLSLADGFVVDPAESVVTLTADGLYQQVTAPMVTHYPYHEITRGLKGFQTFFPLVRAINIAEPAPAGKNVAALLSTSPESWIETSRETTRLKYNEGVDIPGPVCLGAAVEDETSGARLVVFGNASFASNKHLSPAVANQHLFINAVNWLAEDEALISIRPQSPTNRSLSLTPIQHSFILVTTLLAIPLAVFGAGVVVWWKRR